VSQPHPATRKKLRDAARRRVAAMTPEQLREFARLGCVARRSMSPERRTEIARHAGAARNAATTPAQRREQGRAGGLATAASMTPEERNGRSERMRAISREYHDSLTPEQQQARTERGRKSISAWNGTLTDSQRRERDERIRAAQHAMTSIQLGDAGRKSITARTFEQRSASAHKAWRTRRGEGGPDA